MIPGLAGILAARRHAPAPNVVYDLWVSRVDAAGGTYEADSKDIALELVQELQDWSGYPKMTWLLPPLGSNLAAMRVPLIDRVGVGIATNNGFVGGDYSQATGLQGGGTKNLDTLLKTSQLDVDNPASSNGGFGYYLAAVGAAGGWCFGQQATNLYGLHFTPAPRELAYYGDGTSLIDLANPMVAGHYYLQSASATDRKFYLDGVQIGADTSNTSFTGIGSANIFLMGINNGTNVTDGRCGFAYCTDGTLTPTEIAELHTLLDTYLITATGR